MRLFGWEITRRKPRHDEEGAKALTAATGSRGGWISLVTENFPGAWQQNITINRDTVLTFSAVYSCITLIASDIGKLRLRLLQRGDTGVWTEVENPAYTPVLRKQNRFQTRLKFVENWVSSKLIHGNTYILKGRDNRGIVTSMVILDPTRVRPLVADDGSVFYEVSTDNLAGLEGPEILPASEIIHDTMVPLYHPLVGVSPIQACGLAAIQGLQVQKHSARFFGNNARPSGILTAPGTIQQTTAERIKREWEDNYGGENFGKTAVLGDGLKYEPMSITAEDAQLIETLRWTREDVCSCFHVPPFMVGIGSPPTYDNVEGLNQIYYSQTLQTIIESIELSLDEGLGLRKPPFKVGFDLDDLLRMDTTSKTKAAAEGIGAGFLKPNEARARFDLPPVVGGDTPYLQQQNFSLAALHERDQDSPLAAAPQPQAEPEPPVEDEDGGEQDGGEEQRAAYASDIFHRAARFDVSPAT